MPEPTDFTFESEHYAFKDVPRVLALHQQGQLKYSQRNIPSIASLKKISKQLHIMDFFNDSNLLNVRAYLLAGLISFVEKEKISTDFAATLKNIFQNIYLNKNIKFTELLLNNLKGFGSVWQLQKTEQFFLDIIKKLPLNKWVLASNLLGYANIHDLLIEPISDYDAKQRIHYDIEPDGKDSYKEKIYAGYTYDKLITTPVYYGHIFLLSAAGLIDIMYNTPDTKEFGTTYFFGL